MNLAAELLDRAILAGHGERVALRYRRPGDDSALSVREIAVLVNRAAFALRGLGVAPGDAVVLVCPAHPAALIVPLACARLGACCVLDASAAAAALKPVVALTTAAEFPATSASLGQTVRDVVVIDDFGAPGARRAVSWAARLAQARDHFTPTATLAGDAALAFRDPIDGRLHQHGHRLALALPALAPWLTGLEAAEWLGMVAPAGSIGGAVALLAALATGVVPVLVAQGGCDEADPLAVDRVLMEAAALGGDGDGAARLACFAGAARMILADQANWPASDLAPGDRVLLGHAACPLLAEPSAAAAAQRSFGGAIHGLDLRIVDDQGVALAPGLVGRIAIATASPTVADGHGAEFLILPLQARLDARGQLLPA